MRYEEVELGALEHGDQIAVMGKVADLSSFLKPLMIIVGGHYFHHGLYDAKTLKVIHFTGDSKANAKPIKSDFTKFYGGHNQLFRVAYEDGEKCFPADVVMMRAEELVRSPNSWPDYDILLNNCETFAFYLKTGKRYSEQASTALQKLITVAGVSVGASISCSYRH